MQNKCLNLKLLTLSIMLILLSFCLCGCANVNFVTYHNSDGSISEYVYLTIDETKLIEHGYNPDSIKNEIRLNSFTEANNLLAEFQNKLTEQYQNQILTSSEYTTLFNGLKIFQEDWNDSTYAIGFEFKNSSIYKKYYEIMNGATFGSNTKEIKNLFYTKTYYYGTTNYGDYSIFNRIYNYYANSRFASISPQETTLNYSYSVSTKRFHSDADEVTIDTNGNYIHTWQVSPHEPSREICFYTISANKGLWILTCIIIGLGTTLIIGIIAIIKYYKNKWQINLKLNKK